MPEEPIRIGLVHRGRCTFSYKSFRRSFLVKRQQHATEAEIATSLLASLKHLQTLIEIVLHVIGIRQVIVYVTLSALISGSWTSPPEPHGRDGRHRARLVAGRQPFATM